MLYIICLFTCLLWLHPCFLTPFHLLPNVAVFWDAIHKKKITSIVPTFPTSISALAFNDDGTEIAVASSYTYEEGEREHPKDEIYVRPLLKSECSPKVKS